MRIPALDGIRGFAILVVVLAHAFYPYGYAGGPIGVSIFFVLSGFLITRVLLRGFTFRQFFARRARRLLPAFLLMVVVMSVAYQQAGRSWWPYTWPALLYISDFIASQEKPLMQMVHAWSLSVEEHFYMVWPVAFLWFRNRRAILLVLILVAVGWRLRLNEDPFRAYFSTDGNTYALLLGCATALSPRIRVTPKVVAPILGALVVMVVFVPPVPALTIAPMIASGLTVILILAALDGTHPLLEIEWLRWLGVVSYGLYLWHYPIMILLGWSPLVEIGLSLIAAAASWYWWEKRWLNAPEARPHDRKGKRLGQSAGMTSPSLQPSSSEKHDH